MTDHRPKIPTTEQPRETADTTLEASTLDKQAKSASYRDVLERTQHLETLNRRIDVLQGKLDNREADLQQLLPRNAALEQSCKISRVLVTDGTALLAIGGGLVSASGVFVAGPVRFVLAGLGGGLLICALWICKVMNRVAGQSAGLTAAPQS
jgi:hypothetical protein